MKSITVVALIELLQGHPANMKVIFTTDYGDRSHTEQALPIHGDTETVVIEKSAYSNSGFAIGEDSDDEGDEIYLVVR